MSEQGAIINLQDERVLRQLFNRFYPRVCLFAERYLVDKMISVDIAQEAFLYMWEHSPFFKNEKSFQAYLYNCVKNKCLNYIRDHRKELEMLDIENTERENIADKFQTDHWMIENELKAKILEEINRLPGVRRDIMLMRLEGESYEEISKELQLNINTLKTYKKQIYRELRIRLKDLEACMLLFLTWGFIF